MSFKNCKIWPHFSR